MKINKDKENIIFNKPYMIMILALISCFLWGSAFPSVKVGYEVFSIPLFGVFLSYVLLGERVVGTKVIMAVILVIVGIIIINTEAKKA
ncbi:hypothetical protein [Clostridium sp. FP1]|uniref:hypothetical protein n=1 Tax=Clostridium sp. FP1 TaxID=2724076 RepID=UPI0013E95542|nr:hypothetical protein [Clostridium sp. FP1]MBZ9637288.1 hypothetical protein [Clostridium sp. FP1]